MKIAVSSMSFHNPLDTGELKLSQVPTACAVLGIQFVELNDAYLRTKRRTGRLLSLGRGEQSDQLPDLGPFNLGLLEKGLRAADAQLVCFTAESDLVPKQPEPLPEQVRYVKAAIGAARYLDCSLVRLWLTQSPTHTMDVASPTVAAFREITDTATKAGVRLALEHRFGRLEELEAIIYIIEEVRSFYLGACLNFGRLPTNAWQVGLNRLVPYAIHVHAPSRKFDADGNETTVSYQTCIETLKNTGYQGFVSIEYVGRGDPLDGIIATKTLIENCLAHGS